MAVPAEICHCLTKSSTRFCRWLCARAAADQLLARAASIAGHGGLRCLVSYRALASLAEDARESQPPQAEIQTVSAILDRLRAADY
jgi:hypothetical protein